MDLARQLVFQNVPFVIRSIPDVKALQARWNQAYLSKELGQMRVMVQIYKDKMLRYTDPQKLRLMELEDPEGAQELKEGPGATTRDTRSIESVLDYVAQHRGSSKNMQYAGISGREFQKFPDENITRETLAMFTPLIKEHRYLQKPTFRLGFNELRYGAHFDWHSNYLAQVAGVKRVVLFNPVEGHKLHWVNDDAHPHFRQALVWPRLNLQNQSEFPDFLGAKALQVVLHPGDMLLIPALWLHYLEAKSPVASDNAGETSLPFWLNVNSFAAYTNTEGTDRPGDGQAAYICPHGHDGKPIRGHYDVPLPRAEL